MFIITERQYSIIMKQAQACYPQETGGFLGGRENTILGILPIPNKRPTEWSYAYMPILGPLVGGVLGALLYQVLIP